MSIKIRDLSLGYSKNKLVLKNISYTFNTGEVNLLLGPSGCGKSSLMYILKGLIPHSISGHVAGDISNNNISIKGLEPSVLAPQIGLVFQDPDTQFATFTVEDELLFGMENLKFYHDMDKSIDETLKILEIEHLRHRSLNALSGGEKQRVAIASVLSLNPEILIFDEPTSNLDVHYRKMIFKLIKKLKEEHNKTIIILEFLIEIIDNIVVLNTDGEISAKGSKEEVLKELLKNKSSEGIYLPKGLELLQYLKHEDEKNIPLTQGEIVAYIKSHPAHALKTCINNQNIDLKNLY
ncbi:hypothetical protein AZF37_05195 [endosymbiont 'TC1' of Trimyema compressum]|uniref:energy-coupling factor ABC transporter ATP-binding protein n=1 Tax=endosymbiont 'TC1' of Trimyema compressum TaxID=243899 RepID=UPI0007F16E27|nr:ABC transporter ATP-binding protein [endosymbiont 'TC1' of Trimyema compressum]AMP20654.1 hypothetical protein AZF37_05195 [endosymbiont 'TC1' of Trimyema compressum]